MLTSVKQFRLKSGQTFKNVGPESSCVQTVCIAYQMATS